MGLLCLGLAGCGTVGPDFRAPDAAVQEAWVTYDSVAREAGLRSTTAWWQRFGDPALDRLVTAALADNLSLQGAALRIVQAQAQFAISDAAGLPSVQLAGGVTRSEPDARAQLLGQRSASTAAQVGVQAAWEIDFWGKVRRGAESDKASYLSTVAAYRAAQTSLAASVASTYLSLRTLEQRLAVARANLTYQAESRRIAEARFRYGATSELDLRQAQTQYEQTQAQIPNLEASLRQTRHALALLLGKPADFLTMHPLAEAALPAVPPRPDAGLPRDLLRQRPDVVQAEFAAAAQSARIGQSMAALYPSFSLSGSVGYQASNAGSNSLNDLFSWGNRTTAVGGSLLFPLFDRGRLKNQVRVQDALFEQALLAYEAQVLKAQQEVEDALASIASGEASLASLTRARDMARRSAEVAMQRYKSGAADYTTVTAADQARLQVEDNHAQTEGRLLQAHVDLHRALGGGWDGALQAPALPARSVERMTLRIDWGTFLTPATPDR